MNYGDIEEKYCQLDTSKIVMLPVLYDETSTWIKGADNGPEAIIEASANMEFYDIETDAQPYLNGIHTAKSIMGNALPELMVKDVTDMVSNFLNKDKFVVTIGGEHSVSIGAIGAHSKKFKDMTVLQLDAHSDLRSEYENSKFNHACVMARVKEVCSVVQVGIRSMDESEKQQMNIDNVFFAKDIFNDTSYIEKVIKKLTDNVYITIDLDVFDPSIMPSTGTPEPGGLFWYDILKLLKTVCKKRNVVGFDVVELCPNDSNKAPDFLAAKLIYKMLAYKFNQ